MASCYPNYHLFPLAFQQRVSIDGLFLAWQLQCPLTDFCMDDPSQGLTCNGMVSHMLMVWKISGVFPIFPRRNSRRYGRHDDSVCEHGVKDNMEFLVTAWQWRIGFPIFTIFLTLLLIVVGLAIHNQGLVSFIIFTFLGPSHGRLDWHSGIPHYF